MPGTRVGYEEDHVQLGKTTIDRAIVGGSSEVNGGPLTIEEACPRCGQTL